MEQIRKCRAFICSHEEEQTQERMAESYFAEFNQRRQIKKQEKQNPPPHPTHPHNTIYNSIPQQKDSPSLQRNDSSNKYSIIVREEFNYKSLQKASTKAPETQLPFSPQLTLLNSPPRSKHIQNYQGSPCSISSSQFAKKSLKASATGRVNCNQKSLFHHQERTGKQRKGSYKFSDYSTTQSVMIGNNGAETFQNTLQANTMNGAIRKIGGPERWSFQGEMQKLKKTDQLILMNSGQHKALPYNSNNIYLQNQTQCTQNVQNRPQTHSPTFQISDKMRQEQQMTFRTFIDSLREEHFIEKVQMESSNYSQNGSCLRQSQSVSSQSVFKDLKSDFPAEQRQIVSPEPPMKKDRTPQHRQTAFAGHFNFQHKDMNSFAQQLRNVITMQSICSQKLEKSYVDINYPHKTRGNITKLL